jgi:hypothetical protein
MRVFLLAIYSLPLIALSWPALATDGVAEINHTCAVQTGCSSGDAAGYPVVITGPGSYLLTSDLPVVGTGPAIVSAIGVRDVTIDLNGFTISGMGSDNGIQLFDGDNWEIRNGTIKGFNNGIQQGTISTGHRVIGVRVTGNANAGIFIANGEGHLVRDCTATGNGGIGIGLASRSRVVGNTVSNNTGAGMSLGTGTGYGGNVVNNNGGTVSGGVEMGANICDGTTTCP